MLLADVGVSAETAVILIEQLANETVSLDTINVVANTRKFWLLYGEGRARLAALRVKTTLPQWRGDWAHFNREQLHELLPGLVLRIVANDVKFTRYFHETDPQCLDLHTIDGRPICRHPFALNTRWLLADSTT